MIIEWAKFVICAIAAALSDHWLPIIVCTLQAAASLDTCINDWMDTKKTKKYFYDNPT
jgi:hypothetical protein